MLEQAVAQVNVVAIRVARGGDALVDLEDVHVGPGHIFVGEVSQHQPRAFASADRHDEASARGNRSPGIGGDDRGRALGQRIDIRKDFDVHGVSQSPR